MKNSQYAIIAVLVILIGGGSFYGGTQYQKSKSSSGIGRQGAFRAGGPTGSAGGNRMAQGGFANGEIISTDDQGLTLKLTDGGSKIVFLSASTTIGKIDIGTKADLTQGLNVMVTGTTNQDGSITANSVQIRPAGTLGVRPNIRGAVQP